MDAAVDLLPPLDIIYGTSGESPQRSPESEVDPSGPEAEATPFYETHGRWTCMRSLPLDTVLKSTVIQSMNFYKHDSMLVNRILNRHLSIRSLSGMDRNRGAPNSYNIYLLGCKCQLA